MTKIYKLLIDSPEIPKGSFAVFKDEYLGRTSYTNGTYYIFYPTDSIHDFVCTRGVLYEEVIENRPLVWELQEEKLDIRSPEAERMREESRATRYNFVPKEDQDVFIYDVFRKKVREFEYSEIYIHEWNNGFIKSTDVECEVHGNKYARYFLTE